MVLQRTWVCVFPSGVRLSKERAPRGSHLLWVRPDAMSLGQCPYGLSHNLSVIGHLPVCLSVYALITHLYICLHTIYHQ